MDEFGNSGDIHGVYKRKAIVCPRCLVENGRQMRVNWLDWILMRREAMLCLECDHRFYEYDFNRMRKASFAAIIAAWVLFVALIIGLTPAAHRQSETFPVAEADDNQKGTDPVTRELLAPASRRKMFKQLRVAKILNDHERAEPEP